MLIQIPTYTLTFDIPPSGSVKWAVSETDLEAVVKVLRRNGIRSYEVREGDPLWTQRVAS